MDSPHGVRVNFYAKFFSFLMGGGDLMGKARIANRYTHARTKTGRLRKTRGRRFVCLPLLASFVCCSVELLVLARFAARSGAMHSPRCAL